MKRKKVRLKGGRAENLYCPNEKCELSPKYVQTWIGVVKRG